MARTEEENDAIYNKIQLLIKEGFPERQATAIAFRMFKDGELYIPNQKQAQLRTTRKQKKVLLNQMSDAFQILGLASLFKSGKNRP